MILGLEVREDSVAAVAADESGAVAARRVQSGGDVSAALQAVQALGNHPGARLGVAVRDPLESEVAEVAAAVARAAGVPTESVRVVTRGTALALAEQWRGAAREAAHVAMLAVTDCVQAGVVVNGLPFEGAHGLAAAAGWLALNPVEREDYRKLGCLEAEIGALGIVRRIVWRLKAGDMSRVLEMADGDMAAITVPQIFDAARTGDGVAISVVRDTARYVGMAIGNLVAILDPEVVVLGGLIANAADLLVEPSRTEAARRMPAPLAGVVRVVPAALGDEGGALGAARAAMLAR